MVQDFFREKAVIGLCKVLLLFIHVIQNLLLPLPSSIPPTIVILLIMVPPGLYLLNSKYEKVQVTKGK